MPLKVLYIPGVLGSSLSSQDGGGGPLTPVWIGAASLLNGGMAYLQLAPDGVSPGPLAVGKVTTAVSILGEVYSPLAVWLQLLGYDVLALGFDWRLSLLTSAQRLYGQVMAWLGAASMTVVCHSMGGLLARLLYAQMQAHGTQAQFGRLICIGTPHYGSFEPVRLWWKLPALYRGLAALTGWVGRQPDASGPDYLDAVLASHPSWYELTAFAGAGPLFTDFPNQAKEIYGSAFYGTGANRYVSQALLTSAELVQGQITAALPPDTVVIAGVGHKTTFALVDGGDPAGEAGYQYTQEGDGDVTLAQASPPGVPVGTVNVGHAFQPLHPAVWLALRPLLP